MATSASVSKVAWSFDGAFEALTGNRPYPWQKRLFELFIGEAIPRDINLPTGAGKTSVVAIWLIAIARQSEETGSVALPRRLVWVVDRRVVVDQATNEAEQISNRLEDEGATPELNGVREGLRKLSHDSGKTGLIAISTLRGEKEDNRKWSTDPSRPAIIVGTVDMVGSRLLFSGYGDGRYWRAQHAGLLGHDALIINDEAHLTPAFAKLLSGVEKIQNDAKNRSQLLKPFRTIRLSATHPDEKCWPESLEEDRQHPHFKKVFEAKKKLHVLPPQPAAKLESAIVELATQEGAGRTIVFVTEPEKAQKIARLIQKEVGPDGTKRVLTLTGTMRGFERDQLVEKDEFKVFTKAERPQEDYWLVATSAGEVGVNISSDRLITTLDTLDHLLQRFGRLNRFGETDGVAYLICGEKEKDKRKAAALEFLRRRLPAIEDAYDISPATLFALHRNKEYEEAYTEPPLLAPLLPWHIDVWSQTSLGKHPSRPEVEPWLHGKQENNPPRVHIAWREDVEGLTRESIDGDDLRQVFKKYRLLGHEQLQEPVNRLLKHLDEMLQNATAEQKRTKCLLRRTDGKIERITFEELVTNKKVQRNVANCQLILPPGCGELRDGMFVPAWVSLEKDQGACRVDVAAMLPKLENGKTHYKRERACYRAQGNDDLGWQLTRIGNLAEENIEEEVIGDLKKPQLDRFCRSRGLRLLTMIYISSAESEDENSAALLYFGQIQKARATENVVYLNPHDAKPGHLADVVRFAEQLAKALHLAEDRIRALVFAGKKHDLGKENEIWQDVAGRRRDKQGNWSEPALAKARRWFSGKQLRGFRHDFESLRLIHEDSISGMEAEVLDLALHLIASHHGHSRPCFEDKAYGRGADRAGGAALAFECVCRFARLQRRFGPWALAYLEAVFQAADITASRDEEGSADE